MERALKDYFYKKKKKKKILKIFLRKKYEIFDFYKKEFF
jgi:hypothetical protein